MNNSHILLHLALIKDLALGTIDKLVPRKPASMAWADLYSLSVSDLVNIFKLRPPAAEKIHAGLQNKQLLENELALIKRHGISWTTVLDPNYPALLGHIQAPPAVLYWQGNAINDADKKIAIVGSRLATTYAEEVIDQMVPLLVNNGWVIVSGGAAGADTMAHKATLAAGGKTVVVVGTGLLECYPKKNRALFEHVVEKGGTIVSIFPLTSESSPLTFPARNRVISGLSRGCVVAQAADKSGALITARFALEQGREVFAVPGLISDALSYGCHAIIQQGAKLVTGAADIVAEFGEVLPVEESDQEEIKNEVQRDEQLVMRLQKTKNTGKKAGSDVHLEGQLAFVDGDETTPEGKIIRACVRPCTVDDLLEISSLPLGMLQSLLFDLQLNDKLVQTMTGMWQISQK